MFDQIKKLLFQKTRHNPTLDPVSQSSIINADIIHNAISSAEQGRTRELFALYRDSLLSSGHLQSEFAKRKLAVLNEPFRIMPADKTDDEDSATSDSLTMLLDNCDQELFRANVHLLDSSLYPVSVVEKVFYVRDDGMVSLRRLVPVPHTLLDYQSGDMMILDGSAPEDRTRAVRPDPDRYIIHRGNLMTHSDCWGGPMRSLLFWWLLASCDRTWWSTFLEKYGTPFMVGRYDSGDDASRSLLEQAFSWCVRVGGLVVSRDTEIELKQASASDSGDAFEKFHAACDREISKIVIGQTLSSDAQSTGLGSGVAGAHEAVRADIRRFDAIALATTIRDQLLRQLCKINNLPGSIPKCTFGMIQISPQITALIGIFNSIRGVGLEIADDGISILSDALGVPLQRSTAMPVSPFSAALRSDRNPSEKITDDLSQAFRARHAEIARIIRDSKTPDECLAALTQYTDGMRPGIAEDLIEQALRAFASQG